MPYEPPEPEAELRQLREVLLDHLWAAGLPSWPGSDGLTVQAVLSYYQQAAAVSLVPGRQELMRLHPNLADALNAYFTDRGRRGPLPQ